MTGKENRRQAKTMPKEIALTTRRTSREQIESLGIVGQPTRQGTNRLYGQKNGLSGDLREKARWNLAGKLMKYLHTPCNSRRLARALMLPQL
jgi:hypothetical protein